MYMAKNAAIFMVIPVFVVVLIIQSKLNILALKSIKNTSNINSILFYKLILN